MPRYFFNVHDGRNMPDPNGTELPDPGAARQEAIRFAGRLLDEDADRIGLGEDWQMEVTDERGLLLFRLDFHVTAAPAISEAHGPR